MEGNEENKAEINREHYLKKTMKNIILLLFISVSTNINYINAQEVSQRKNVIKVNILPPILSSTGEISYERIVKPNVGLVLGVVGNFRADQSEFDLQSSSNIDFSDRDIQNFYLLGEVRRYIDFCNDNCSAPHGFYAGAFFRYNQLDITVKAGWLTKSITWKKVSLF